MDKTCTCGCEGDPFICIESDGTDSQMPANVAAAIKATEYKYFGDYEMSDDQRKAVDVLVEVARSHYIQRTIPDDVREDFVCVRDAVTSDQWERLWVSLHSLKCNPFMDEIPLVMQEVVAILCHCLSTPSPDSGERMREALEQGRPFSEWHEGHGDVLWWKLPILESPYCGSPIDLGRSMKVVVQIGFEEHDLPITMTGGWPFSDEDEESLWWTPLPKPTFMRAALQESAR